MTMKHSFAAAFALCAPAIVLAVGDAGRGAEVFRACAACHSLVAGEHRTGPSLASAYGRSAGSAPGFRRYSDALRKSGVVWNEQTLDAWLSNPAASIPGNAMAFRGLPLARDRSDLIAYLRTVSEGKIAASQDAGLPDLKAVASRQRVRAISYCGDTYRVTLGDDSIYPVWEYNLRFKTDSSPQGPRKDEPVIVGTGMRGDRAQVVFAAPGEISAFIRKQCN